MVKYLVNLEHGEKWVQWHPANDHVIEKHLFEEHEHCLYTSGNAGGETRPKSTIKLSIRDSRMQFYTVKWIQVPSLGATTFQTETKGNWRGSRQQPNMEKKYMVSV